MKTIMTVIGTRPQFVKAAALSRELRKQFKEILVDTGQHYDYNMAGVFFEELDIPKPDINLEVGSGSHGEQTAAMMAKLERVVEQAAPDGILVYGDTNSTLAGALIASKMNIPLFHIEAGLRSYNMGMPEEVNRKLTDHVSNVLFAPTDAAVRNLQKEGIVKHVHQVGDVMLDAIMYYGNKAALQYSLDAFGVSKRAYCLVTLHRAENTNDPGRMEAIVDALTGFSIPVLIPLHPRTKKQLHKLGLLERIQQAAHIHCIEPVSYLAMLLLECNALAIITDSGGVQKEAYFTGVPCFTLRDETEWLETVEVGWNTLVNPLTDDLQQLVETWKEPQNRVNLYGNGRAAVAIMRILCDYYDTNCINLKIG